MKNLYIIVLLCGRVDSRTSFLHIFLSSSSLNYFYSVEDSNYWLSRRQTWQEQTYDQVSVSLSLSWVLYQW